MQEGERARVKANLLVRARADGNTAKRRTVAAADPATTFLSSLSPSLCVCVLPWRATNSRAARFCARAARLSREFRARLQAFGNEAVPRGGAVLVGGWIYGVVGAREYKWNMAWRV